jgi:phosphatidylinositol-3-phosphatase
VTTSISTKRTKLSSFAGLGVVALMMALAASACSKIAAAPAAEQRHVFLIVMENKSPQQALQGSFTASLAAKYRVAGNYTAISHPSLPNYLALTSGQTYGIQDDNYYVLPKGGIGDQLTAARVSWRAYMEGMSRGCLNSPFPYALRHNPFAYYGGACPDNVVPFTSLAADLNAANSPRFSWISPDACHDEHSCNVAVGDDWLRQTVGMITQSKAWTSNGLLVITWDEDDGSRDNHVLTLLISRNQSHRVSNQPYTHYSLLATIENVLGVGRLGEAAGAKVMSDLLAA